MAESKSLKKAVDAEVKQAEENVNTGNVETVPESKGGPVTDQAPATQPADLPTGTRSHPA